MRREQRLELHDRLRAQRRVVPGRAPPATAPPNCRYAVRRQGPPGPAACRACRRRSLGWRGDGGSRELARKECADRLGASRAGAARRADLWVGECVGVWVGVWVGVCVCVCVCVCAWVGGRAGGWVGGWVGACVHGWAAIVLGVVERDEVGEDRVRARAEQDAVVARRRLRGRGEPVVVQRQLRSAVGASGVCAASRTRRAKIV
jgi:hypothetical protein